MATNDTEIKMEVRDFTGIDTSVVSEVEMDTVLSDAKRHIKLRRSLSEQQVDWYGNEYQEEALNWATKLFMKVAAGELDSGTVQVGAIDDKSLLSKDDNSVTMWFRNMERAIRQIEPQSSYGIVSSGRREYGVDDEGGGDGSVQL